MKAARHVCMVAVCLALAGCGSADKKPSKHVQRIHHATASVLAHQVNSLVPEGGIVLLVHRQAAKEIARSWEKGLNDSLDERFTLVVYGYDELSEEAATSFEGAKPLAEGMQSHDDAVAVISAIEVDPRQFKSLPRDDDTPMFALEWPFLDVSGPLLNAGLLKAGVFEKENRDISAKPERGASPEEIMSPRHLLAIPDTWKDLVGK